MKAVIFDMDGVIIDSEPIHLAVDKRVLKNVGVSVTDTYLEQYIGMTNPAMWRQIIQEFDLRQTVDELIAKQIAAKMILLEEMSLEPIVGVSGLIQTLRASQIKVGLASSSPRAFIDAVLQKFSMLDAFTSVVSGEEVAEGKPAPDVYLKAAMLLGISPSECVAIEDAAHGVTAAKRAGMKCIAYRNPTSGTQDLSLADHVVDSLLEVNIDLIRSL